MTVTDIRVKKILDKGRLKGVVSVIFDNEFMINDIRIIEGENKLFVAMPNKKLGDGSFKDIVHPLNPKFRDKLEKLILEKYKLISLADESL